MNIQKEKKEIETRYEELTQNAQTLRSQLTKIEEERSELRGQFKLLDKLENKKEDKNV